ncbi:MAG TPA: hypothetical protein VHM25_21625, partial [Polyangiaceae bacterium]|nr:hypothetical protein [Polyangiaceae bacterium]
MFENLLARYRQPGRQKLFWTILAAKLLGVVALFAVVKGVSFYFATPALADDAAAAPPAYVNPLNTMWTLVAAFLVFFMQAGFMMLEAGFARTRETVNILLEGIVDTCLCGILFWAWGFAFMFGSGNGFIGKQYFFLHGTPETFGSSGVAMLGGKVLGAALLMLIVMGIPAYFGAKAWADDAPLPPYVNPINTMWVCITAFLVFFMQAGFMFLEAGFARTRETVNVLLEGIVDTCLCGILFWAFGFAFMFGSGNGFIGHQFFFLHGAPETYGSTGVSILAFFLFQYAFADTCSTITSGAMVGRTGFVGDILYSIGVSGFIYPIIGHWAWGPDGWLNTLSTPFHDFAGSTVVHTIGGFVALAGAIALGPRLGRKFKRDGGGMPPGHDMTIAAIGGVILWFGWYGFNPGSTLSAMDMAGC